MSGFGIYVHWPYCARICPYCDFNVYRARGGDNAPLIDAIVADIEAHAARLGKREVASIFLGGGTPSLLRAKEIERIVEAAGRAFVLNSDCEITLEANPENARLFSEQAAAGVNRFSIGVQSLEDAALRALGRNHDASAALRAVEAAAATGARVSLDLIYAREGQSIEAWCVELQRALALEIEHASLYQLTIERNTAFGRRASRGQLALPNNEEAAAFFEATQEVCDVAGFPAYEISNHARTQGAQSRHNLLYWRGEEWIGVGPGAHGRLSLGDARVATEAHRLPRNYMDAVRENGVGWVEEAPLSGEQVADEELLMGLRIAEGVELGRQAALRGRPLVAAMRASLLAGGFMCEERGRLRLTKSGRLLADRIAAELVG